MSASPLHNRYPPLSITPMSESKVSASSTLPLHSQLQPSLVPLTLSSLTTPGAFSLSLCTRLFEECARTPLAVPVIPFLRACLEIKKIVSALGTILGFASIEINDKVSGVLLQFNQHSSASKKNLPIAAGESKEPSEDIPEVTLQSLLNDEVSIKGGVDKHKSTARELFRLLWTLDFITSLMNGLADGPDLTLKAAAVAAYSQTLSQHHGKLIRISVSAALLLLPDRQKFLKSIAGAEGGSEKPEFVLLLKELTGSFAPVRESLWAYYREHGLADGKLD